MSASLYLGVDLKGYDIAKTVVSTEDITSIFNLLACSKEISG